MILHTDIPTRANIDRLLLSRDPASVSIYVPTDPASSNAGPRTGLRNLGERRSNSFARRESKARGSPPSRTSSPICSTIRRSGATRRGRWQCC